MAAPRTAKAPYRKDQLQPIARRSNAGSSNSGKPSSASREAKFDSANSRYGTALLKRRQYHDCRSGVVVESKK